MCEINAKKLEDAIYGIGKLRLFAIRKIINELTFLRVFVRNNRDIQTVNFTVEIFKTSAPETEKKKLAKPLHAT